MRKALFALLGLVLVLTVKVYAYDDGDFQIWNTDAEEFKISNETKISLEQEFRWADNANIFYYHHYDIGLSYSLKKYLNLSGGYRHAYELKKGKFKLENEPYLAATLLWDFRGFKFENKNRMEYRHFDYQADSWRYRNRVMLKPPWALKLSGVEIQPYLADEIFIGFGKIDELNQNRFSSGLAINLTKNFKGEIYYMLQDTKTSGKWLDTNILGTKIKVSF